ncbi:MAG: efflux RND transporter permease subunit, partial [Bacteroidota bacterium]|nr:efflux RND transporter permease subunit [Bacteroidota bacterium]
IPLDELADIKYTKGPAKISRENTNRRVFVSVNVRDRDLQSVVNDIQATVEKNVTLKPGNYIVYGGQFENLQNATKRLMLAVPVALLLIFIFLHFAFKSIKDTILIYTAIPLSIVGGVIFLWIRGMPFSVSAGIGFIALFGIAVLNGIVLIEHLKDLHKSGMTNMKEIIIQGTKDRLRPVMLTASAAAMGFLPMAVSTGAGAEVQRPLATVVIGGLITSTMLTMIVLPLLFEIFYSVKKIKLFPFRVIRSKTLMIILLMIIPTFSIQAQTKELKLNEIIDTAINYNYEINAYRLNVDKTNIIKSSPIDKTFISVSTDENNLAENNYPLNVLGIQQSFKFPTLYIAQNNAKKINVSMAEITLEIYKQKLKKEVSFCYYEIQNLLNKKIIYSHLDSLYVNLLNNAEIRYTKGDLSQLDLLAVKAKKQQTSLLIKNIDNDIEIYFQKLKTLMNYNEEFSISESIEFEITTQENFDSNPVIKLLLHQENYSQALIKIEQNKILPDFSANYFIGTNYFDNAKYYQGFEVGISIPIFFGYQKSKIQASKIELNIQQSLNQNESVLLKNKLFQYQKEEIKYKELIDNFNNTGKLLYQKIIRTSEKSFQLGEIDLFKFIYSQESALQIKTDYLDNVLRYNKILIEQKYLSN